MMKNPFRRKKALKIEVCLFAYGGIDPQTHACLLRDALLTKPHEAHLEHRMVADDALISRSRSRATGRFLQGGSDVLVMIDHDIAWNPGDIVELAQAAVARQAVVGGLYSYRTRGAGFASQLADAETHWTPGGDKFHFANYVATGFIALPRKVIEDALKRLAPRVDLDPDLRVQLCEEDRHGGVSYPDLFRPFTIPSTLKPGTNEYLSEDWAACRRLAHAGVSLLVWEKPALVHYGRHGFTQADGVGR